MDGLSLDLFRMAAGCGSAGILPSLYDGLCQTNGTVQIQSVADIFRIAANGVRIAVMLAGLLAIPAIFIAGIYYAASLGDPGRVKRAKDILTNMVIGLVIAMGAYAIITFITDRF
jgi:hypothetical protein